MGASKPAYLVQLHSDWASKAVELQNKYTSAKTVAADLVRESAGSVALSPAATQAALAELNAAKAYNDFLETGTGLHRLSQEAAARLNNPNLSDWDRHQLQNTQRSLQTSWEAFSDFLNSNGLKPIHVPPVYADNKIHHVDGAKQWDQSILGQVGSWYDAGKTFGQQLVQAATLSQADQYTACVGIIDAITGRFMEKRVLPAHGEWAGHGGDVWGQLAGKAFDLNPAGTTCRLIFPSNNVPEYLRKYGPVQEGHDETLGALAAIDVDPKVLAQFGLADVLATEVAAGNLNVAQAQQMLNGATGSSELALYTPAPPTTMDTLLTVADLVTITARHRRIARAAKRCRNQRSLAAFALSMPATTALQGLVT